MKAAVLVVLACCAVTNVTGQNSQVSEVVKKVRDYRLLHEHRTIRELVDFLAIPNTAGDATNISGNADALVTMLRRQGFHAETWQIDRGGPVVFAELSAPGARRTVIFYGHYDGQPAQANSWTATQPFEPALRSGSIEAGGRLIPFPNPAVQFSDDWRLYARSAADDKSPLIALLTSIDALRDQKVPLAMNVKVLFEGEEEAGSPHLEEVLNRHRPQLAGDLLLSIDGPISPSGRMLVYFGNRGIVTVKITVFGPLHPLHSGHYGNWVPNPAMRMAQLLASMKDADGHVLIKGFYDDVTPFGDAERSALEQAPAQDAELLKQFGVSRSDGDGKSLLKLISEPSLNVDGLDSGWVSGNQPQTIIPDRAEARLDLRLVKDIQPQAQVDRLMAHIRSQGYEVLDHDPTTQERLRFPRLARVEHDRGYPASRTDMSLSVSRAMVQVVENATGEPVVKLPTLGGSVPMYVFENLKLPVIGLPIANYDDNQHAPDENIRIGNFWRGVEVYGAVLAGLHW